MALPAAITPIDPGDWHLVKNLRLRALTDTPRSFGSSLAREIKYEESDWVALVSRGRWFHATSGGVSIGIVAGITGDDMSDAEVHLISFWVDPASRSTGIAARLLDAVREWACASGARLLTLWVADESLAAKHFYARMGFVSTGQRQPLPSNPLIGEERMTLELGT